MISTHKESDTNITKNSMKNLVEDSISKHYKLFDVLQEIPKMRIQHRISYKENISHKLKLDGNIIGSQLSFSGFLSISQERHKGSIEPNLSSEYYDIDDKLGLNDNSPPSI